VRPPAKLTTYNPSTVASAGTIIYLAGEKRIAAPNAFFRFHHVTQNFSKPPTSMSLDEFTDEKTSLAMSLERLEQIYRERTSLTSEQIVVRLLTRTGLDWTRKYPPIAAALTNLPVGKRHTSMASYVGCVRTGQPRSA
jgi:hypothetical protein